MSHTLKDGRPCAEKDGHNGRCRSVEARERERARAQERFSTDPEYAETRRATWRKFTAKLRAVETVCGVAGCERIAPVGDVKCRKCSADASRAYGHTAKGSLNRRNRRERKAEATDRYEDLTALDAACYLCGSEIPEGQGHVEHVMPLARIAAQGSEFRSAVRRSCAHCNISKRDLDPATFALRQFKRRVSQ